MREAILAFKGRDCRGCNYAPYSRACYPAFPVGLLCQGDCDDLLALLRQEIEKVEKENPYRYAAKWYAWERCCQKILKKLSE